MAVYYFHLRNDRDQILDRAGRQFDDMGAVRVAALEEARGVIAADAKAGRLDFGHWISVENGRGEEVHRLRLADAVEIVGLPAKLRPAAG